MLKSPKSPSQGLELGCFTHYAPKCQDKPLLIM